MSVIPHLPTPAPDLSALSTDAQGRDRVFEQFRSFGGQMQAWYGGCRLPIARVAKIGQGFFDRRLAIETVFIDGYGRIVAWKIDHADIGRDPQGYLLTWKVGHQRVNHRDILGTTLAIDPVNKALIQITDKGEAVPFSDRSLIGVGEAVPLKERAQRPERGFGKTRTVFARTCGVLMELAHPIF